MAQATPLRADVDITDPEVVERLRKRSFRRHVLGRIGVYVGAVVAALLACFPFIWAGVTAFKQDQDFLNFANNPFKWNMPPTLESIRYIFEQTNFLTFVSNTVLVGGLVVLITLVVALPAAYSLARLDLKWSGPLGIAIFMVYLVPPSLLFVSLSRVVAEIGLQDSKWSLVVVYPTITIPVSVWLLVGFFKAIPRDIEEQAMVDGYSRLASFARIAVPLVFPGIVAVIVFAFTLSAHEFIYSLAFVAATGEKTLSVGVPTELVRGDVFYWQELQGAALMVAIPIAFIFNLFLERFIAGFTMGAVKG
jgi:multiple sugar transport system permease protein